MKRLDETTCRDPYLVRFFTALITFPATFPNSVQLYIHATTPDKIPGIVPDHIPRQIMIPSAGDLGGIDRESTMTRPPVERLVSGIV